jgi:Domain of unknown function (DUF4349)
MNATRTLLSALAAAWLSAACSQTSAPPAAPSPMAAAEAGDQVFVRTATQDMTVKDPAAAAPQAREMVRAAGGKLESETADDERVVLVVRVPEASLDSVLARLGTLGKVNERRVSAVDVTAQVTDVDARLRNLTAARDRLRQTLAGASNVQDVVAIEREIARLQSDIDVLEGTRRRLATDVALSRVTLTLNQQHVLGPLGLVLAGLGRLVGKLFVIR